MQRFLNTCAPPMSARGRKNATLAEQVPARHVIRPAVSCLLGATPLA